MALILKHAKFLLPLTLIGAAACNEEVVVEEPEVTEEGETLVGSDADPLYVGVWAADEDLCGAAPGEPGPVDFTTSRFLGHENTCEILSSEEGTEGGWRLQMRCSGEGETVMETFDVDLDGDRLRVSRNGGEPVTFISCTDDDDEDQLDGALQNN